MTLSELKTKTEILHDEFLAEWKDKRNFKELFVSKILEFCKKIFAEKNMEIDRLNKQADFFRDSATKAIEELNALKSEQ